MKPEQSTQLHKLCLIGGEDINLRIPFVELLRRHGYNPVVFGSGESRPFDENAIQFRHYNLNRRLNAVDDLKTIRELKSLIQKEQPALVHAFDTKPSIYAVLAAHSLGIKSIRTITGLGYVFARESFATRLIRMVLLQMHKYASARASMTIFQNPDDMNLFLNKKVVSHSRAGTILSSGIDIDHFLEKRNFRQSGCTLKEMLGRGDFTIVTMVSRLTWMKGVDEYLKIARRIRKDNPNVLFLLVGPIDEAGVDSISLSHISQYDDDLIYLGKREDVPSILSLSDIFFYPSFYCEGIPRVLLEAGVSKIPSVVLDIPGCREVIQHGKNGFLAPVGNIEQMIDYLNVLIGDPQKRIQMGNQADVIVREKFTIQHVADQYIHYYQALIQS